MAKTSKPPGKGDFEDACDHNPTYTRDLDAGSERDCKNFLAQIDMEYNNIMNHPRTPWLSSAAVSNIPVGTSRPSVCYRFTHLHILFSTFLLCHHPAIAVLLTMHDWLIFSDTPCVLSDLSEYCYIYQSTIIFIRVLFSAIAVAPSGRKWRCPSAMFC